jgi:hypothetical protein
MNISMILIPIVVVAVLLATAIWIVQRRSGSRQCAKCGSPAAYGYSKAAESDLKDIARVCEACLLVQLKQDYGEYIKQAVVVQPVPGLPCYVFRPKSEWDEKLHKELDFILGRLESKCSSCGGDAHYMWLDCAADASIVADIPAKGIVNTLSPALDHSPVSLCGHCVVKRVGESLSRQNAGYLEVCGPYGPEDGLVIAMGY